MNKRIIYFVSLLMLLSTAITAQNNNSSTTARPRTTNKTSTKPADSQKSTDTEKPKTTSPAARTSPLKPVVIAKQAPGSEGVLAAFELLLKGIRKADVATVTDIYWNSPRLILFNNNGTVTKGWAQMRKNRESSYPDVTNVKLDVKDISVSMLGRDGALVSCLWTQSQNFKGTPETASGRMTLVFKRVGKDWKVVHLHTSPDKQDPSRVLPSEQTPSPVPSPTPKDLQ